jgi:hypothetical protein
MNSQHLAHVSFTISGDQVLPEFWTRYFDVVPDIAITKGDPITDPTGQGRILARRTGVWGIRSKLVVNSSALEPHLRYLVNLLKLPKASLRELLDEKKAEMRFFCYWANYTGDRVPDVPDDIRTMMESMGGIIDIDEYR